MKCYEVYILLGFRVLGFGFRVPPHIIPIYYSTFHFLFHYPHISPIYIYIYIYITPISPIVPFLGPYYNTAPNM